MDHSYEHFPPHRHSQGTINHDGDLDNRIPESFLLDNIIVGYAFGPKKMETMGLIMAEASKALSTFECAGTLSSIISKQQQQQKKQQQINNNSGAAMDFDEASAGASMALTSIATGESSEDNAEKELSVTTAAAAGASRSNPYFSDNDEEDTRSLSSTYTRASFMSQKSGNQQRGSGGNNMNGIQLTFLPDSNGFIHLVRKTSSTGGAGGGVTVGGGEGESITGSSITTSATTPFSGIRRQGASLASCSSLRLSLSSSPSKEMMDPLTNYNHGQHGNYLTQSLGPTIAKQSQLSSWRSNASGCSGNSRNLQRHPIRVSFVPIDLDTPLEEQHGGKFDVILHKMTEDILCMSKMLRARGQSCGDFDEECENDNNCEMDHDELELEGIQPPTTIANPSIEDPNIFESTPSMTRHQARASRRIQRLREYKQKVHPSCVLVDSPNNILAVMSRADMAEVLSRCLAGVTTKGGIPVRTPRFRVVDEESMVIEAENGSDESSPLLQSNMALADEIDNSGFEYPLIAKPLTAAGTKSSHHMGIVLARDGLQRLKTPCLLQEYANHGEVLFKVYVLGESVWVFSRQSLPNLPMGEKNIMGGDDKKDAKTGGAHHEEGGAQQWLPKKRPRTESYVEFERPAGSRCYVEFNSQRPYPKLSDFGIVSGSKHLEDEMSQQCDTARSKVQRIDKGVTMESFHDVDHQRSMSPNKLSNINDKSTINENSELERYVTKEEIEPVTAALRDAFGLELFGFDILVKNSTQSNGLKAGERSGHSSGKEILVVDVNYFPGYKEVPNFPSLLAQYLTQKAVASRVRIFDGS